MGVFRKIFNHSHISISNYDNRQYYLKLDRNIRDYIDFLDDTYLHIHGILHNNLSENEKNYIETKLETIQEISNELKAITLVDSEYRINW